MLKIRLIFKSLYILKQRKRGVLMIKGKDEAYKVAKKMIIDGESWDKIMDETRLRLKDLRRIQKNEIDPHF